MPVIQL